MIFQIYHHRSSILYAFKGWNVHSIGFLPLFMSHTHTCRNHLCLEYIHAFQEEIFYLQKVSVKENWRFVLMLWNICTIYFLILYNVVKYNWHLFVKKQTYLHKYILYSVSMSSVFQISINVWKWNWVMISIILCLFPQQKSRKYLIVRVILSASAHTGTFTSN